MTMLRSLYLTLMALTAFGCASPDEVRPFPLNPSFTERKADPGRVDSMCHTPGGTKDNGQIQNANDTYCGCVDCAAKIVWLARTIACDMEQTARHENCHIETGSAPSARLNCALRFPQPQNLSNWNVRNGR